MQHERCDFDVGFIHAFFYTILIYVFFLKINKTNVVGALLFSTLEYSSVILMMFVSCNGAWLLQKLKAYTILIRTHTRCMLSTRQFSLSQKHYHLVKIIFSVSISPFLHLSSSFSFSCFLDLNSWLPCSTYCVMITHLNQQL